MSQYPEHEKLTAVRENSQTVGEFLEWLKQRYRIVGHSEPDDWGDVYDVPAPGTTALLAEYFHIDEAKLEEEKRVMIAGLRALNALYSD